MPVTLQKQQREHTLKAPVRPMVTVVHSDELKRLCQEVTAERDAEERKLAEEARAKREREQRAAALANRPAYGYD